MELAEIIRIICSSLGTQNQTEQVSILEAGGRILAEDIFAVRDVPHFPKAAMDGYAILSEDSREASRERPVRLLVAGEILAGDHKNINAVPGTAVRIMTGSCIPPGFDCVIRQEDTDYGEETVSVYRRMVPWENYCKIGEDLKQGQLALNKHRKLDEIAAGVLASLGIFKISVYKPLKVGVLNIGSELMEPEHSNAREKLPPGKIYNSNGYILKTALERKGIEVAFQYHLGDVEEDIRNLLLEQAKKADIIITTGGVSVGKADVMPGVLRQISDEFYQGMAIKPGTPSICARHKGTWILAFSGNPYAVLAHYHMLFLPVAAHFTRDASMGGEIKTAVIEEGCLKKSGLTRIVRAKEAGGKVRINALTHASSVLSNMLDCNCMVIQPAGEELKPGAEVRIVMI